VFLEVAGGRIAVRVAAPLDLCARPWGTNDQHSSLGHVPRLGRGGVPNGQKATVRRSGGSRSQESGVRGQGSGEPRTALSRRGLETCGQAMCGVRRPAHSAVRGQESRAQR